MKCSLPPGLEALKVLTTDDEKSKILTKWNTETLPNFVKDAERLLEARGGDYFVGGKVNLVLRLCCTLCFIIRVTFFKKSSLQKILHEILISDPHFKGMTKQKLLSDGFLYH